MEKKNKKNPLKVICRHTHSRVWFIVTCSLVVLFAGATVAATNEKLCNLIDMVVGGDRAVLDPNYVSHYQNDDKITTKTAAYENSNDVNIQLCEEGMVLLKNKNNALPLAKGSKISIFGKNSVDIAISGSGSAGGGSDTVKDIYTSLESAGYSVNPTLKKFYQSSDSGKGRTTNPSMDSGVNTLEIGETPQASYTDAVKNSYKDYSAAAIVVITRIGGEGWDLPRAQSGDTTKTFLELDANEEAMINAVTDAGFGKVIVMLNTANTMECGFIQDNAKIDAALWIGFPGGEGAMAIGEILNGTVCPSGHLTDTYARDLSKIPSSQNFGDNNVVDGDRFTQGGKSKLYYFTDYEEGIYVGYRYFETRAETDGETWYSNNVVYPLGYGLSYTNFTWAVNTTPNGQKITKGTTIPVQVTVTNSGNVAGKDVVQIYAGTPYTSGQIEKASKVLVGFEKTKLLAPQESQTLTIDVDPYDFASYDATDANKNGFSGYELDPGAYKLYVSTTSHDAVSTLNLSVDNDIQWDKDPVTGNPVVNRFDYADDHLQTLLSRADWNGTWPQTPTAADRELSTAMMAALKDTNSTDNPNAESYTTMPTTGEANGLTIFDMYGLAYNDPKWDKLLNQLSYTDMVDMMRNAGFNTANIDSIAKPKTTDSDGPVGLTMFMGDDTIYYTCKFACEPLTGATFNKDLIEKMGEAVGNEGLIGNVKGDGRPYTGWYAPGMNIHRNPFGGRCCEYFSEDPYLSGMMAAAEVKGANSKGMVTYLKHFVGNEQETNRDKNGDCSFMNEQTLREIYLKPFEYAVKVGKSRGIMTSFNRLGTRWTGSTYNLLTGVLRNEWGFHGGVITDFNTHHSTYMTCKPMLYAGGTLDLVSQPEAGSAFASSNSAADMTILREATHETLYSTSLSNARKVIGYDLSYWRIGLILVDTIIPAGLLVWGIFAIRQSYRKEKDAGAATAVKTHDGETKA